MTLHCLWSSCFLTTRGRVGAAAPPSSSLIPPPFPGGWWDGGRVRKDLLLPTHSERLYRIHTQPAQTSKGSHHLARPPAPSPQPLETRQTPPPPLPPQPESPHRLTETADSFLKMELLSPQKTCTQCLTHVQKKPPAAPRTQKQRLGHPSPLLYQGMRDF